MISKTHERLYVDILKTLRQRFLFFFISGLARTRVYPANTRRWTKAVLILVRRLRRYTNIKPGAVFSYKLRYIVGFWLVEMAISTNQKPTIYRNLYENTGPAVVQRIIAGWMDVISPQQSRDVEPMLI